MTQTTQSRITQQELESYLWGAAVLLRGLIDAGDYKQFIFPLLFFKRISDVWDEEYQAALTDSDGDLSYAEFAENHRFQRFPRARTGTTCARRRVAGHRPPRAGDSALRAGPAGERGRAPGRSCARAHGLAAELPLDGDGPRSPRRLPGARPDGRVGGGAQARAATRCDCRFVATDPSSVGVAKEVALLASAEGVGRLAVLVLGGAGEGPRHFSDDVVDMEAIDPMRVRLPPDLALDAGRARDIGAILLRPSDSGELRTAPVTFHRWALSAHGAAAACTLKPHDTVDSCIPLHHPAAILVAVGAALVAGARLALG